MRLIWYTSCLKAWRPLVALGSGIGTRRGQYPCMLHVGGLIARLRSVLRPLKRRLIHPQAACRLSCLTANCTNAVTRLLRSVTKLSLRDVFLFSPFFLNTRAPCRVESVAWCARHNALVLCVSPVSLGALSQQSTSLHDPQQSAE